MSNRRAPIVETVTTTLGEDGQVNCAAMGVEWVSDDELVLRPFAGTRTLRNLRSRPEAVVHLTDDVLLFSQAALDDPHPPVRPAQQVQGAVIVDACAWREVRVTSVQEGDRATVHVRVVARGSGREQLGLNRARHAVVEASILASRLDRLPAASVASDLARLHVLVDKTGGERERQAMEYVDEWIARRRGTVA